MRRYIFLLLLIAFAQPAQAQRVFRASIDEEQNARLDKLEVNVDRLTNIVELLAQQTKNQPQQISLPEKPAAAKTQTQLVSNRYSQAELEAIVRQHYPNGNYTKYADVRPRSGVWRHLQDSNHGFNSDQISGMNQNIALGLHGLHHKGMISPYKSREKVLITQQQPTQQTQPTQRVQQVLGGCANGQCARQTVVRRSIFFR